MRRKFLAIVFVSFSLLSFNSSCFASKAKFDIKEFSFQVGAFSSGVIGAGSLFISLASIIVGIDSYYSAKKIKKSIEEAEKLMKEHRRRDLEKLRKKLIDAKKSLIVKSSESNAFIVGSVLFLMTGVIALITSFLFSKGCKKRVFLSKLSKNEEKKRMGLQYDAIIDFGKRWRSL